MAGQRQQMGDISLKGCQSGSFLTESRPGDGVLKQPCVSSELVGCVFKTIFLRCSTYFWCAHPNKLKEMCRPTCRNLPGVQERKELRAPTLAVSLVRFETLAETCQTNPRFAHALPDLQTNLSDFRKSFR